MNMASTRKRFYVTMRSRVLRGISLNFQSNMEHHKLHGTLKTSYENRTIDVNCSQESQFNTNFNTLTHASLSGGERSKTLVCLINSLWSAQQAPMRCLDEWDVYLDAVARQNMEKMLVETASRSPFQYFFISPQGSVFCDKEFRKSISEKYVKQIKVMNIKK